VSRVRWGMRGGVRAGLMGARPEPLGRAVLTVMITGPLGTARVRRGALHDGVCRCVRSELCPAVAWRGRVGRAARGFIVSVEGPTRTVSIDRKKLTWRPCRPGGDTRRSYSCEPRVRVLGRRTQRTRRNKRNVGGRRRKRTGNVLLYLFSPARRAGSGWQVQNAIRVAGMMAPIALSSLYGGRFDSRLARSAATEKRETNAEGSLYLLSLGGIG
jgi:hypothetical protein